MPKIIEHDIGQAVITGVTLRQPRPVTSHSLSFGAETAILCVSVIGLLTTEQTRVHLGHDHEHVHGGIHASLLDISLPNCGQALVPGGQDIDLLTTEQVLEHGGQDRDHPVAVFEQNEEECIDFHTGGSGENVHSSRCYLSTKLR